MIERLDLIEQALADHPNAALFKPTIEHLRWGKLRDLQEFHVQEFDLSRRHALHLTYWTDGDTRRRGEVLAAIKQTYRDSGLVVETGGELPDFLPMVLEFAARGDHDRGLGILNSYRASLELLRLGLKGDKLPQEGIVEAICLELPGELANNRAEVQQLYGAEFLDNPPVEQVGLTTYQIEPMRA